MFKLTATLSSLRNPVRLPEPYWMLKAVPLALYVLDLVLSYLLWRTENKLRYYHCSPRYRIKCSFEWSKYIIK